jgi:hypothetical protein
MRLGKFQRWGIAGLGLSGIGGGSVAVFTQEVEAGPVAMLGLGALFFLIGFSGVLPTRLKIGENEAEWLEEVGQQIAVVAELVPQESKLELESALQRLSQLSPQTASPAMAGLAYEELVVGMLELSLGDLNASLQPNEQLILTRPRGGNDWGFDVTIEKGAETVLGVEIKAYSSRVPVSVIRQMMGQFATRQAPRTNRALLVTQTPLTLTALEAIDGTSTVMIDHVQVSGTEDHDRLTETLRRIVTA